VAVPRHGKKYGNSAQNGCEKTSGQRSCGRDKTPPIRGLRKHGFSQRSRKETDAPNPMVPPRAHITGIKEKPRAILVSSVSSASMLFTTPMFPFSMPFKQRLRDRLRRYHSWICQTYLRTSAPKERERPNRMIEMIVPKRPHRSTGFRPM